MAKTTKSGERSTIVLAWTDMEGLRKTGRMVQRDLNWFPEFEAALRARAVIWLNAGYASDVAKAQAYAAKCGHDNAAVYTFPTTEEDPLGKAEAAVLASFQADVKRAEKKVTR